MKFRVLSLACTAAALLSAAAIMLPTLSLPAQAQTPASSSCTVKDFGNKVGQRESTDNYGSISDDDMIGRYQFNEETLHDFEYTVPDSNLKDNVYRWTGKDGINSTADFLANKNVQDRLFEANMARNWKIMQNLGVGQYVGQTLPDGTKITQSGLLAASQFGAGKVSNFFKSGMNCNAGKDGNGICVAEYMNLAKGYDVSSLTGQASDAGSECGGQEAAGSAGEPASSTCGPSMAIIEGTNCMRFPGSLQSFCMVYKPFMMTRPECPVAEDYAKNSPRMGPNKDACIRQTDQHGTMSWSYVLACSQASDQPSTVAPADDPECYNRLKGKGVEFTELGTIKVSGPINNEQCYCRNCVLIKKTSNGAPVTVNGQFGVKANCSLAEKIDEFSTQLGLKGMDGYGAVQACRWINNASCTGCVGKLSWHGTGEAIDLATFDFGGQKVKSTTWASANPLQANIARVGCSVFHRVLGPAFYKGKWTHFHFEINHGSGAARCATGKP